MRVRLKKMLVLLVNASSLFGNFERSTVIGPTCRQETEKLEGSSFSPKGLSPAAFPSLRYVASDARHGRVVEFADADLVIRRQQIEGGTDAGKVVGVRDARGRENEG